MMKQNADAKLPKKKVLMKLRKPKITASIWSSGKIICTGATSEEDSKLGAQRLPWCLQRLGFKVKFTEFKVCTMPFEIRLPEFTKSNRPLASTKCTVYRHRY
ncbi:TATA box-binding protein-like 1 isoform X2 [Polyodon spathula]|uniref:TATA box-binding protein-like 1 isoform X2 n=1 Tax=Polyodon spathula TaxID=7913 RepID=UPI001B7F6669|nr:TATA box-binding protein-like 1 isoform X2 [Polyodon spathula]